MKRVDIKSSQTWYDQKTRKVQFNVGQKIWFYNPRRKKGRAPKLQSSWEGPYFIVRMMWFTVFVGQAEAKIKLFTRIG